MPSELNSEFDWYDIECDKAGYKRQGFVACYTEQVIPLLARIAELEASNESLVEECHRMAHTITTFDNPDPS